MRAMNVQQTVPPRERDFDNDDQNADSDAESKCDEKNDMIELSPAKKPRSAKKTRRGRPRKSLVTPLKSKRNRRSKKAEAQHHPIGPFSSAGYAQEPSVKDKIWGPITVPIFSVAFNPYVGKNDDVSYFATIAGNAVTVYESTSDHFRAMERFDIDEKEPDSFWTVAWLYHSAVKQFVIAVAGEKGVIVLIRIANIKSSSGSKIFGHLHCDDSVNELVVHPCESELLLSCGVDGLMCLWHTREKLLVAIFGGLPALGGHCLQVISADFSTFAERLVSGGADRCIKIWQANESEQMRLAILEAATWKGLPFPNSIGLALSQFGIKDRSFKNRHFNVLQLRSPIFSISDLHSNYVDCVRWWGSAILSKSCEGQLILWQPDAESVLQQETVVKPLRRFNLPNARVWYMRFGVSCDFKMAAIGDECGILRVFNLESDETDDDKSETGDDSSGFEPIEGIPLWHNECYSLVRMTAFAPNGKHLVAVCEDGTIFRWAIGKRTRGWEREKIFPALSTALTEREKWFASFLHPPEAKKPNVDADA